MVNKDGEFYFIYFIPINLFSIKIGKSFNKLTENNWTIK